MTTPRELAAELRLTPRRLRDLIREHKLAPMHERGKRYSLTEEEVVRIIEHPAVRHAAGWLGS